MSSFCKAASGSFGYRENHTHSCYKSLFIKQIKYHERSLHINHSKLVRSNWLFGRIYLVGTKRPF